MKFKLIFLILLLNISAALSQSNREIKIIVLSKSVTDSQTVYITGNHPAIGNWDPAAVPLTIERSGKWIGTFSFPVGFRLEFKLTLGSWEMEALDENENVPSNMLLEIVKDTTITIEVKHWKHQIIRKVAGKITGTVKYHEKIGWNGLRDRDVAVWLPPGYNQNPEKHYPVLYMHDGQNMFDPKTSAFGVDWQIDEAADSLIRKGFIEPVIIVGIYNTPDRSYEYTPGLAGYSYMNFVVSKLKPFIDSTYRTLPGKKYTSTGGSSLGGLISFMLVWVYPDVFSQAACISPAFKIGEIDFVSPVKKYTGKKKEIRIYIDDGSVGLEDSLQRGIDDMLFALQEKGYIEGDDLYYYKALGAKHFESDWAERIWRPLIFMFGNENSYQYIREK